MSDKIRPRRLYLLVTAAAVLFLSSCLDVQTELSLSSRGEVKATIVYVMSESFSDYGRGFGADDPWPLPLSEVDFRQKALMTDGAELVRYKVSELSNGDESVKAVVRADSVEVMAEFLGVTMSVESPDDGSSGSLRVTLPTTDETWNTLSEDTRTMMEELIADSSYSLTVKPPSKPLSVENGLIDRRRAVFSVDLNQLLQGEGPESWSVTW